MIEVSRLKDVNAAELFLGFRKGPSVVAMSPSVFTEQTQAEKQRLEAQTPPNGVWHCTGSVLQLFSASLMATCNAPEELVCNCAGLFLNIVWFAVHFAAYCILD